MTKHRDNILRLRGMNNTRQVQDPIWLSGYSDASFKSDPPCQGGGWGIWVRDSKTRIIRSGVCPDWVINSGQAEFCAVWAAIHTALTHLDTERANILVVKTDNQDVARCYGWNQGRYLPKDEDTARIVCMAFEMAIGLKIKLVVTWVKGHQSLYNGNVPGYLNHRVDRLASQVRKDHKPVKIVEPIRKRGSR